MKIKITTLAILLAFSASVYAQEYSGDLKKYSELKTYGYSEIYFGWNFWRNADGKAVDLNTPTTTELDGWPSTTWGFGFGGNTQFGESNFAIRYGLQFNWHFFRLKSNTVIRKVANDDGTQATYFVEGTQGNNYKKSTFRVTYMDLPVLVQFFSGKRGTSKGLTIAFGPYGGLRLGSSSKEKYSDVFGDQAKDKLYNNYFVNTWRYGLMAQFGFSSFKFTAKMDLNNLFDQSKDTPDYQVSSITFGYVFP